MLFERHAHSRPRSSMLRQPTDSSSGANVARMRNPSRQCTAYMQTVILEAAPGAGQASKGRIWLPFLRGKRVIRLFTLRTTHNSAAHFKHSTKCSRYHSIYERSTPRETLREPLCCLQEILKTKKQQPTPGYTTAMCDSPQQQCSDTTCGSARHLYAHALYITFFLAVTRTP